MINFVTLFDKNYFSRGMALYASLARHCDNFILFILAMDSETENALAKNKFDNIVIISLDEIESYYPELLEIKKGRTTAEYCWTLTSHSIQYAIKRYDLVSCTYIDADVFFFNDPTVLLNELGDNSVIITEHNYTPEYDQTKTSGKYCVQFMCFKNDSNGLHVLEWWRQRCADWCYARSEDGKFGDQKYLDDWISRFNCVYVPTHIGCGIAPWNIQLYDVKMEYNKIIIEDKTTKESGKLLFFHFHGLKKGRITSKKVFWHVGQYCISDDAINMIYKPYILHLEDIEKRLYHEMGSSSHKLGIPNSAFGFIKFYLKNLFKAVFLVGRQYNEYKKRAPQYIITNNNT
jgi:hypothetical protein